MPQFAVLALQRLDPLAINRRWSGPLTSIPLGLAYSIPKRLTRAADLGRDRADHRILRAVLGLTIKHHPDCTLADLRRKGRRALRHGSILSRVGASGKPGAVQLDQMPGLPKWVVGGRGYTSHAFREHIWNMGARPAIPPQRHEAPVACPDWIYNNRQHVERLWARLKE